MNYKLATLNDVERINDLYFKCSENMKQKFGLNHWDSPYPQDLLESRIKNNCVYVAYDDDLFIATFMVVKEYPQPYIDAIGDDNIPFRYANRLAVLPELQGRGIGKWGMAQMEQISMDLGAKVLRLDALSNHEILLRFFKNLGYEITGIGKTRRFQVVFHQKFL